MSTRSNIALPVVAALLMLASSRAWSQDQEPTVHLSWRAPYGTARATDTLPSACRDTTGRDSLYVTFRTAKGGTYYGLEAAIFFHSAPGDSLGPLWDLDRPGLGFQVEFPAEGVPGAIRGWRPGAGLLSSIYRRMGDGGRLQLQDVLNPAAPTTLRDSTEYLVARILIPRRIRSARCKQPICIEWGATDFAFQIEKMTKPAPGGQRWVGLNTIRGRDCGSFQPGRSKP